ncbi:serine/threonine-protein kinase [Corallococcus macrosporus]|uniref:Serine/threonine-protein kinase n=1 Tax=Myxococcus fulvus (strain ATCC BAA-855 / HW-1) TaxID=483219 RepID=F8CHF7_MYXFH|nr:serine/threonine-protein kinase [Corallococcus macrosporus]
MPVHAENWQVHPGALGPGTEVGSWRVVERLGVGGYGAVYRVEDMASPGDFYALKLALRPGDERAEREVHLLMSKGVHPNVVRLHASGRWPHPVTGFLFFVMDWVPGLALHTWVETLNPSFRQLAEKVGTAALALGALHARGVLHRDFKPEHILIREKDGEPILLDFGVGRYAGAATVTTAVLPPATLHLLSPEAMHFFRTHYKRPGARYEVRATDDLYALGVCLYRVVTGYWPFSPEQPPDLLYMQIKAVLPAAPLAVNSRVPRALSDVIMRLLAKKPEARFQSGHEVHAALVAAVAFGTPEEWEFSIFEWEDAPDATDEPGGVRRRIRRSDWPTASRTPPPRRMVLGPVLAMPRLPLRRSQAVPGRAQGAQGLRRQGRRWPFWLVLVAVLACATWAAKVPGGWLLPPLTEEFPAAPRAVTTNQPARWSGHEMAQEVESPETAAAAAPPLATPTPAAAAPATHAEVQAAVKMLKTTVSPATPTPNTKAPGLGSMGKALCVGVTSAALACSGTPVRPEPPPEPCPPGAVEAMEKLGIRLGDEGTATFFFEGKHVQPTTVTEGMVNVRYALGLAEDLPQNSRLSGRLIFGERVYGRLTRARSPDGSVNIPVCLELWDRQGGRGLIDLGKRGPTTATVLSTVYVRAVREFE